MAVDVYINMDINTNLSLFLGGLRKWVEFLFVCLFSFLDFGLSLLCGVEGENHHDRERRRDI